jgi:S-adenosylmethionine:tRNA ribosyltransferase-isomerase
MRAADFTFDLPESQIALHPAEPRDSARLMAVDKKTGTRRHLIFRDLPSLLRDGDLLVVNDTRVIPARLFGNGPGDRQFELLLLKEESALTWRCLARPGKKVGASVTLVFAEGVLGIVERASDREFRVQFTGVDEASFRSWLDRAGKMPLPPYLKRPATEEDRLRYQTMFARDPKSVAAPTAGLHFTPELLSRIEARGVHTAKLTLEIGYGTFAPVQTENLEDHRMHEESYFIPPETVAALDLAKREGRRVICVGTTSLRALESLDTLGPRGNTSIFIRPGYEFRRADGLITNFHLPESTLLVLICAFLGKDPALEAYREAVREGYRFFSYGDAMAILS